MDHEQHLAGGTGHGRHAWGFRGWPLPAQRHRGASGLWVCARRSPARRSGAAAGFAGGCFRGIHLGSSSGSEAGEGSLQSPSHPWIGHQASDAARAPSVAAGARAADAGCPSAIARQGPTKPPGCTPPFGPWWRLPAPGWPGRGGWTPACVPRRAGGQGAPWSGLSEGSCPAQVAPLAHGQPGPANTRPTRTRLRPTTFRPTSSHMRRIWRFCPVSTKRSCSGFCQSTRAGLTIGHPAPGHGSRASLSAGKRRAHHFAPGRWHQWTVGAGPARRG